MKTFNLDRFCSDLTMVRGTESHGEFARKLGVNREMLMSLETGEKLPNKEVLIRFCNLSTNALEKYFDSHIVENRLQYLINELESDSDKRKILEMEERIDIREKYEILSHREQYLS